MKISKRAKNIAASLTLAISAKAKQMKKEGIDVVSFGAGEPDFDTPEFIKEAGIKAIKDGFTKYTPTSGTPELKEAICEKFKKDNDLEYKPSQIIVSCGAKHSLYNIFMAILDPGDEVIIPAPYWLSYPEMVKMAGGVPVFLTATADNDFKITPEQLESEITKKTVALVINSPSNPTGSVYTKEELEQFAEIAYRRKIAVVSDEIYEKLIYDGEKHVSIASLGKELKDMTFVVNGMSKSYSMTGWRIGYAAGPEDAIASMGRVQDHSTSNPTSISQVAALAAIKGDQSCVKDMLVQFDKRRKYIVERLTNIPGVKCPVPKGAFYVLPDMGVYLNQEINGKMIKGSMDLCDYLLDDAKVSVVPGVAFGADTCIRLSYATSMENIEKGLDRIEKALLG